MAKKNLTDPFWRDVGHPESNFLGIPMPDMAWEPTSMDPLLNMLFDGDFIGAVSGHEEI